MSGNSYDEATKTITVHGRGSLTLPIESFEDEGETVQRDLSASVFRFEVDGIPISELAVTHPTDPLSQVIVLERAQISMLKKEGGKFDKAWKCTLVDETRSSEDIYEVIWSGYIKLDPTSYVGPADTAVEE